MGNKEVPNQKRILWNRKIRASCYFELRLLNFPGVHFMDPFKMEKIINKVNAGLVISSHLN